MAVRMGRRHVSGACQVSHPDRKRQIHPDPPFLLTLAVMFAILGLICVGLIFVANL